MNYVERMNLCSRPPTSSLPVEAAQGPAQKASGFKEETMAISVRGYGMHVSRKIRRLVDRRVAFELSRFGRQVRAVTVNLEDLNGPRGGIDKRCSMQADLAPGDTVRVEKTDC